MQDEARSEATGSLSLGRAAKSGDRFDHFNQKVGSGNQLQLVQNRTDNVYLKSLSWPILDSEMNVKNKDVSLQSL